MVMRDLTLKRRSLSISAGSGSLVLSTTCRYSNSFLYLFWDMTLLIPGTPNLSYVDQYISPLGRLCIPLRINNPKKAFISVSFISLNKGLPFCFDAILWWAYSLVWFARSWKVFTPKMYIKLAERMRLIVLVSCKFHEIQPELSDKLLSFCNTRKEDTV